MGALALIAAFATFLAMVGSADAAGIHQFKEVFGGSSAPTFTKPASVAVDQDSGDVLVLDAGANEVQSLKVSATAGQFKLTFGGQTTGWTGQGTLSPGSTAVTGLATTTGSISKGEEISGPGIKPNTKVSSCAPTNCVGATSITLSQATEASAGGMQSLSTELPFNVTAANLREALERLSSIGVVSPSSIAVSGGPGDATGSKPYVITFQNALGGQDVGQIVASSGATPLTGGSPSSEAAVTTTTAGIAPAVSRFNPDGSPSDFSALGSNTIDGRRGPGGKTLAECETAPEPASCDETPQNGLLFPTSASGFAEVELAIDNSEGPNSGDIYVPQPSRNLVSVFSPGGKYLTQIDEYRPDELQTISLTGFNKGDKYTLSGLPASCSASTTEPIVWSQFSETRSENARAALEAKCGANFSVNSAFGFGTVTVTVEFTNSFGNLDVPQLSCTVNTGPGSCSVATTTQGHEPTKALGSVRGVAVDPDGSFYLAEHEATGGNRLHKYVPSSSPPTNGDSSANFLSNGAVCNLAAGDSSTVGFLFAAKCSTSAVEKLNEASGTAQYSFGSGRLVAVNPETGDAVVSGGDNTAVEYDASGDTEAIQLSTLEAGSLIQGLAVSGSTGDIYLSRSGSSTIDVFGPTVFTPTIKVTAASEVSSVKATLNATLDPEDAAVLNCKFEYLSQAAYAANGNSYTGPNAPQVRPCSETLPVDSDPHPVSAVASGLKAGTTYHFRAVAENAIGTSITGDKTFTTADAVITGQATAVGDTTATLNGSVNPVGASVTACKFEYLTANEFAADENSYSGPKTPQIAMCNPPAASIEADFQIHAVEAVLSGLAKNTTYHFRLSATNASGTLVGADHTFTTNGGPQIVNQVAFVKRTSATLKAWINPSGFPTTYHFEWGADGSYGHSIPADTDLFIGSGNAPVEVVAQVTGLSENTPYHFRVVATSVSGSTNGEDRRFVTLDTSNLPDDRGAELVSPADKRPGGVVGSIEIGDEGQLFTQAAASGGGLVYPLLNGITTSTAGGFLRENGTRTSSGWESAQISAPSLVPPPDKNISTGLGNPGLVIFASPDLSCAIVETFNPLTDDTPAIDVEFGVTNLYRWTSAGGYELITNRVPLNPETREAGYASVEASDDCNRVYFTSGKYEFFQNDSGLFEWDHGVLRDAGLLPDGTTASNPIIGGSEGQIGGRWNAVSPDGSRLFFSAVSDEGPDAGKRAIFMRSNGGSQISDISQSQTTVATNGALFEFASVDGQHVIFKANYGIADTSSPGPTNGTCGSVPQEKIAVETTPCDLYDYDVETGELTDLSADGNPADTNGATVQGAVAVSPDGSHVYFAATGKLVSGKGKSYAENNSGMTSANIYLAKDGELSYVTNLGGVKGTEVGGFNDSTSDLTRGGSALRGAALMRYPNIWSANTTADGETLLFEAAGDVTGYDSGGIAEAYLYSAGSEELECISCRPDGLPSVRPPEIRKVGALPNLSSPLPRMAFQTAFRSSYDRRAMSADGKRIFFTSPDVLASGGVADAENVYEWEEGQIYFLAIARPSGGSGVGMYLDASSSGDDVFIATSEKLAPQDIDFVSDAYDLRVGGGFAPEPAPHECDPAADECQGPPVAAPATGNPASAAVRGQGNVATPPQKTHKKKHKRKAHKKHHHRKGQKHKKNRKGRSTNSNRGGAK